MSEDWVYDYLPDEYKDKEMQAIRAKRDVGRLPTLSQDSISTPESRSSANETVKTSETEKRGGSGF